MSPRSHDVRTSHSTSPREACRRGSVLLVVLVIVAMLSLGAYTFSEIMVSEAQATAMYGRAAETRMFADSGIELVAALLGDTELDLNWYHDPGQFHGVLIRDGEAPRARGRLSIVAAVETDVTASSIRFGLTDESGRLNLNRILEYELDETETREMLMYLPDMTEDLADAILDWLDEDDDPREYGVESEYYLSMVPPYEPTNGPLDSLDELLLVAGVTPELLYGEDTNRNGLLDASENDGEASPPWDDADGMLLLGWNAYLTVHGRESNLRSDGLERLHVNNDTLADLYDEIEADETLGEEYAQFVVAYRLFGPVATDDEGEPSENAAGPASDRDAEDAKKLDALASGVAQAIGGATGEPVTRGGMNLSEAAPSEYKITSLYDLIGAQVQAEIDGKPQTLDSPWPNNPGEIVSYLPIMMDVLSTTDKPTIEGRININQAPQEVLLGIPGMSEELAASIVGASMTDETGQPLADAMTLRGTTGWMRRSPRAPTRRLSPMVRKAIRPSQTGKTTWTRPAALTSATPAYAAMARQHTENRPMKRSRKVAAAPPVPSPVRRRTS